MAKKNNCGPDFGSFLAQILFQNFFFRGFYLYEMLNIVATYHCM